MAENNYNLKYQNYKRLLSSKKWRENIRKEKLRRSMWCEDCLLNGRQELATEVHHNTPVMTATTRSEMLRLAYDRTNLVSLCSECHKRRHQHNPKKLAEEYLQRRVDNFRSRYFGEEGE